MPAPAAGESRLYFPVVWTAHPKEAQTALWRVVTENSPFFYYICNKVPISSRKEPSALLKSSGLKCIFNSLSYVSAEVPPTISELLTQQRSAVARSSDALMWLETDLLHHQATVCSCWPLGSPDNQPGCPSVSYPFGKGSADSHQDLVAVYVPEMSWSFVGPCEKCPEGAVKCRNASAQRVYFLQTPARGHVPVSSKDSVGCSSKTV